MNKPNLKPVIQSAKTYLNRRCPEILTGIGITGMIATTVLAVKATPKALELIDDAHYEKGEDLTTPETIKACWKCYIPAATTGVVSVACLIGANSVHVRRNAALATAYKLSETAFSEYKSKVLESVGEKKEQVIREKVAQERIDKDPVSKSGIIITEKGNTLCYDYISKRYFKGDVDRIRKVENKLNKQMLHDICGYISLNDFYDEIGLEHIEFGDDLGWNVENMIDLDISPGMADDDTPCLVIGHHNGPQYNYVY